MLKGINLQLFAEGEAGTNNDAGTTTNQTNNNTKPENNSEDNVIKLTKDEFEKKLLSEADRRVNQAKAKWEKDYEERVKTERREAERLARLSDEERQKENEKMFKEELSKREKEILKKEMKLEAINILAEKKLPVSFSDILIGDTAEETQHKIKAFEEAFRSEVSKEVDSRLKGSTPKGGASNSQKQFSMNDLIRGQLRR
jgi:hypothetical protein